jgi:hypothetical protein
MSRLGTVVRCEDDHKTPAKAPLALVLLLVTCLPAVAQESFLSRRPAPAIAPAFAARLETPGPPITSNSTLRQTPPPRIAPARTPTFSVRVEAPLRLQFLTYSDRTNWPAALGAWSHNHSSALESAMSYVGTPFVEHMSLPVASISGGRIEFGGFYSYQATQNVLLGLPGGGSLPAWGVNQRAHPGAVVPLPDVSYGLRVALRMRRYPQPGQRLHVLRCLAWMVGAGNGCYSAASASAAR